MLIKISENGYENLWAQEQAVLTTAIGRGWLKESEIESRQAKYLEKCALELRIKIEQLLAQKKCIESRSPNVINPKD